MSNVDAVLRALLIGRFSPALVPNVIRTSKQGQVRAVRPCTMRFASVQGRIEPFDRAQGSTLSERFASRRVEALQGGLFMKHKVVHE